MTRRPSALLLLILFVVAPAFAAAPLRVEGPDRARATTPQGRSRHCRDLIDRKLDDHIMVIGHEHRLKALEDADASRPR